MNSAISKQWCKNIKTHKAALALVSLLENKRGELFKKGDHLVLESLKESISLEMANLLDSALYENKNLAGVLDDLIWYLKNVKVIHLTIAIFPSESFIEKVYSWFLNNVRGEFLLDIEVNTLLDGGVIMEYEGVYFNATLDKIFESYPWGRGDGF
ncbi:hypothetical protein ACFL13_00475 [Patescibacteria group bacterium]